MAKPNVAKIMEKQEILRFIKEKQPISVWAIHKHFHYLSYASIHLFIDFLEKEGYIRTEKKMIGRLLTRLVYYIQGFKEPDLPKKRKEETKNV